MIVSIDYDNTFTEDPEAWSIVIRTLYSFGHRVICVTARPDEEIHRLELSSSLPGCVLCVFAGDKAKSEAANEAGYRVDVWIDDTPERIKKPFVTRETISRPYRAKGFRR